MLELLKTKNYKDFLSKGPNYREPTFINWKLAREAIVTGLDDCVNSWSSKATINKECFTPWKT